MAIRMQRLSEVLAANGDSRSTHYLNISKGLWTPPVKIGPRSSAWPEHETEAINAARLAGKPYEQIRALVKALVASRKAPEA